MQELAFSSERAPGTAAEPNGLAQASRGGQVVVFACSGCSDAGELADRAARTLSRMNLAEMSCLAGVGARLPSFIKKAKDAAGVLVIDGCPINCARRTLELAGVTEFQHLQLHQLGFRKGACAPTPERIAEVVEAAAHLVSVPAGAGVA